MRTWVHKAITEITADFQRSADTHMMRLELPGAPGIPIYLKDESTHPSGSLKHRLARSLFLYGLCNGWINEGTTIVEASSGSTAVSEAYFARLLDLPFVAVMPASTSRQKCTQIEFYGGKCHYVDDGSRIREESRRLANELGGHFMDQFTFAERATDWRGNNNIAESLFRQLELEPVVTPRWVVVGAGTGGTSATIGRYIRYFRLPTQLCVVDPQFSAFFQYYRSKNTSTVCDSPSRIEGIGRPQVEPSFVPSVIDRMTKVEDRWSLAAMLFLEEVLGRRYGASTGTNFMGVIELVKLMLSRGETGPIVTLLCDSGDRYASTYFDSQWRSACNLEIGNEVDLIRDFFKSGHWNSACESHDHL
jgi:cysteine synthase